MKTKLCVCVLALIVATPLMACDTAKAQKKQTAKVKASTGIVEKRAITGTYIKREVRRNGQITDGPNLVTVIDQESIRNSGATDVRQLLLRRGGFH
jgi:outer membrane cobalamin receptor